MNRIREIRTGKNMTLKDLADLTAIHWVNLSRYERGERGVDIEVAAKIAAALNCTVDDLIEKEPA